MGKKNFSQKNVCQKKFVTKNKIIQKNSRQKGFLVRNIFVHTNVGPKIWPERISLVRLIHLVRIGKLSQLGLVS